MRSCEPRRKTCRWPIVYEDSDILVVNKAAGMVVHVGSGIKSGTLVNALLSRFSPH